MTGRAPGGRCEEQRTTISGFSFVLLLLVLPLSLWGPLLPPGSVKWQLEGQPHIFPDNHCGGPGNPELTFQEGGSHQSGTYSHSEDPLHILPPPGPLSCLFFVFLIFLFLLSIGTLPAEQGVGLFPAFSLCAPKWRPFSPSFNLLPGPHAHPMFLHEDLSLATAYLLQPLTFFFFSKAAPTSPPTPKALICSRIQYGL